MSHVLLSFLLFVLSLHGRPDNRNDDLPLNSRPARAQEFSAPKPTTSTPSSMIGSDGLTAAVLNTKPTLALKAHGLIKVTGRFPTIGTRATRCAARNARPTDLSAAPIQHIGKLLVLWRAIPPKAPPEREGRGAGVRVVKVVKFSKSGNHRPTVKKVNVPGNMRIAAGGELKRATRRRTSVKKSSQSA